jgi:hypothetical protein
VTDISNLITRFVSDPETALLIIVLGFALYAAYKGWWVPGFVYEKEENRANEALEMNASQTKALEATSEALKDLTTEIRQRGM